MQLVSFNAGEGTRVGLLDGDAVTAVSDVGVTMADLVARFHGQWRDLRPKTGAGAWKITEVELQPPVPRPGKIICVGLNYVDHAKESPYSDLPTSPVLFSRYVNSLVAAGQPIVRPRNSTQLDWEGEIAVVIGSTARHVAPERALDHVAGYSLFNDASIRDYQFKSNQWLMGKTFDGTGAFGPTLVTADAVPAGMSGVKLVTRVNGVIMQQANTADMIFDVATLIAYITEGITLDPGDVIVSGTPAGVGFARKPPIYLAPGDVVEVEAQGLGTLANPVVAEAS